MDKTTSYRSTTVHTDFGEVTTLVAEFGISEKGSISYGEKTLLANYVYAKDGTYKLVYTIVDTDGNIESFVEDDGILPVLFLSPDRENYVSVQPFAPDKELETSIPVFHRENTEQPKGSRPFVGDFIGTYRQFSIFYDVDIWSDTKPDRMLAVEFENGTIKKKHNVKIPLPRDNRIYIGNQEIHLLATDGEDWLHRQIDASGNPTRERRIHPKHACFREILSLSFDGDSHILCEENGCVSIEMISPDGTCATNRLIDLGDEFYNTWKPVKIAEDTYVTRFNGEFGNGWFTVRNGRLAEFFYNKGETGYKNLLTGEVLQPGPENLIISSLNKTEENAYAVIFYPAADRKAANKELIILNRR